MANNMKVWLFYLPGCPACEATKPIFSQWAQKHPEITSYRADATQVFWPNRHWELKAFPTVILHIPGKRVAMREGSFESVQEIEEWIEAKTMSDGDLLRGFMR